MSGLLRRPWVRVRFQLHPGAEDPGPGNWGSQPQIPPVDRTGLVATFSGGFKINVAGGGFYLNGVTRGTLASGAASLVYYRDGTAAVGAWDRDVRMAPDVAGVGQNLKLIVGNGRIAATVDQNVESPVPVNLLPTQQESAYRYCSVYSRDFLAVYTR